ncbi:Copper resistance protein B precursor [Pseudodesulfovibrio hydrargyri]|uniref:Copper resistance protein B n=1 Tax=Pseudodesulfovibrio hydrargyri TaxID=2125990 RepID=A0A1J5MXZ1_9BACT|nr:copper resistance protein B [Pseudodesulfovibrio hydrargyri]OIQ50858.1 Copper resistance protein B precursor [Pseudodesulfovibrio hydrargyri]
MKFRFITLLALLVLSAAALIPVSVRAEEMEDDPLLYMVDVEKLEMRVSEGDNPIEWDAEAWIGKDLNKLWFKTEGEYLDEKIDSAEFQALYSRAVAPYWDFQAGVRRDIRQEPGMPDRNWLALGFEGEAPYDIGIDTALFLGEYGRSSLRFKADYDILLTQRLILMPEFEANLFGKNDPATRTGSGLSETELGLRLRYEILREFAPYIGVNWDRLWGKTEDYAREDGESYDQVQFVMGVRFRF